MALVPDSGTTWFLTRRLGHQLAFDIATSGRKIDAQEAVTLGLANAAVPDATSRATSRATSSSPTGLIASEMA